MVVNPISLLNSDDIRRKLNIIWDITKPYWYPLFDCKRQDVIAFNSDYIENNKKLESIRQLLMEHGAQNVFELRENGICNEINDLYDYDFWLSESYFWNNECFWFDDNMDWIIYVCHEGITTNDITEN